MKPLSFLLAATALLCACQPNTSSPPPAAPVGPADLLVFQIEGERAPCTGVAPRECLVVNNELFYEEIAGYRHNDGIPARICVDRRKRPEPIAADQGLFTYHRIACPATAPQRPTESNE